MKNFNSRKILTIVAVVLGLAFVGNFFNQRKKSPTEPAPAKAAESSDSKSQEVVANSAWDGSVSQIERYLKRTLNDPDSYEPAEWGKVVKHEDGKFLVVHSFRAKNAFGARVLQKYMFVLSPTGEVEEALDMDSGSRTR